MQTYEDAARAYSEGNAFVAFDLETTGLDPRKDKIVEIGAVKFDNKGLIARFSALVNPGIPMPAGAERVNGISDTMLMGKPPIAEVLGDFLPFIKNAVIIAYNAAFDCDFINEALKERRSSTENAFFPAFPSDLPPALPNPIADVLIFAREIFAGHKSYSLQNFASALGIASFNAHRAEDDARLCMEIFLRCLAEAAPAASGAVKV